MTERAIRELDTPDGPGHYWIWPWRDQTNDPPLLVHIYKESDGLWARVDGINRPIADLTRDPKTKFIGPVTPPVFGAQVDVCFKRPWPDGGSQFLCLRENGHDGNCMAVVDGVRFEWEADKATEKVDGQNTAQKAELTTSTGSIPCVESDAS